MKILEEVCFKENGSRRNDAELASFLCMEKRMRVLFLCSQNKRRSLTAEKVLDGLRVWQVRSAGTENNARMKVTGGLIGWAEVIFTMEKKHSRRIQEKYREELIGKKVVCLNIPDEYEFMDETLIEILEAEVDRFFLRKLG